VQDTFGDAAHDLGLRSTQIGLSSSLIALCDRFFNFTQVGADARTTCFVYGVTAFVLTSAFFCLRRISHVSVPILRVKKYQERRQTRTGF